jgi:hypothetical protein
VSVAFDEYGISTLFKAQIVLLAAAGIATRAIARWNALAMVVRANKAHVGRWRLEIPRRDPGRISMSRTVGSRPSVSPISLSQPQLSKLRTAYSRKVADCVRVLHVHHCSHFLSGSFWPHIEVDEEFQRPVCRSFNRGRAD